MKTFNWEEIAESLKLFGEDGERASLNDAKKALEILLGEDNLRGAVDYYISYEPGCELARCVLMMLKPSSAIHRCYEIFTNSKSIEDKRNAVYLLKYISDRRVLPWIQEFIEYPDEGVQNCCVEIIDQLLYINMIEPEDCMQFLDLINNHENDHVRKIAKSIDTLIKYLDMEN